ncbi:phosphoribosyl-ATP diphosphatase [Pseudohoeflea coraliihabitans]|uniref:Phosphoribosyl-ATP pyrophosphatase n=1 Tax=Pseudohoeflea coraliihabitans TaxID=2860393 RepID=A0ABS6WT33_9HYPH|nr:phosphoribosyl-ATP diphosphatase [Pseudohoeflea sp. DP4N28-3]MBW3099118.1 phosphoribosyl-ATP diphosphatase [Pseudohoeflea sp. DP4N28-3]
MPADKNPASGSNADAAKSFSLADLEQIIADRSNAAPDSSWTAKLVAGGMERAAKKLGEEAVETVIAALSRERGAVVAETADLLFHLLVVLRMSDVPLSEVLQELERRTGQSGLAEKAARTSE